MNRAGRIPVPGTAVFPRRSLVLALAMTALILAGAMWLAWQRRLIVVAGLAGLGAPIGLAMAWGQVVRIIRHLEILNTELEQRVQQRTVELACVREQLDREMALRARNDSMRRSAQKMESLGRLTAGVAHEINNPLFAILGYARGLQLRLPESDSARRPVNSIVREAERCQRLVHEMLTFSRGEKGQHESIALNDLVRSSIVLLEARAKTQGVRIVQDLYDVPDLEANRTQLQQILVNLGSNALDAMKRGGDLTLRTRQQDRLVCLEVADTGEGIPDEALPHVFEPFFTTKDVSEGTGLGLSLVYEIVQLHGGRIDAESAAGKGTTMRVYLPVGRSPGPNAAGGGEVS